MTKTHDTAYLIRKAEKAPVDENVIDRIALSITEQGFIAPLMIDEYENIVAGHNRLMAASLLGLEVVPVILFSSTTKSMQKNGVKDVICNDCCNEFTVRKDTKPKVCKMCASARGGSANKGVYQVERDTCKAKGCNNNFRKTLGYSYCSVDCRKASTKTDRQCKTCDKHFKVFTSALKTNASGNFCSRPCYERFMCKEGRTTGRGSQWKSIRTAFIKKMPFCVLCGTTDNLEVHHIIPFRVTQDNSEFNLVTLCSSHHKRVEHQTNLLLNEKIEPEQMRFVIKNILSEHYKATCLKIKRLKDATRTLGA